MCSVVDKRQQDGALRRRQAMGGFTLVELIVVTVLGSLVVMASLQILITNQRTYSAQSAQIVGQQTTRAALDVLFAELREVSPGGGDLVGMARDSIRVRAMRKFGVVCATDLSGQPKLTVLKVGDYFTTTDSVFVFADNEEALDSDDEWIESINANQVDTTGITCGTEPAQEITFSGYRALFVADSVRLGAPVRSYVYYTYMLYQYGSDFYLGRREANNTSVLPLVGPLRPRDGLEFSYRDEDGNVTTVATDVRQIVVTIRTGSEVLNSLGELVSDSITSWVYTRN